MLTQLNDVLIHKNIVFVLCIRLATVEQNISRDLLFNFPDFVGDFSRTYA